MSAEGRTTNEQGRQEQGTEPPFAGTFDRIVRQLAKQPPLLAALGGGILIVAVATIAGGLAADRLWPLVVGIVLLVLAGLGAWLIASRSGSGSRFAPRFRDEVRATGGGRVGSAYGGRFRIFRPKFRGPITADGGDVGVADNTGRRSDAQTPDDQES